MLMRLFFPSSSSVLKATETEQGIKVCGSEKLGVFLVVISGLIYISSDPTTLEKNIFIAII